jgi:hypothetical protein
MKHAVVRPALAALPLLVLGALTAAQSPGIDPRTHAAAVPGATPGASATPGATRPADVARFYLMDGSIITGKPAVKELRIQTTYGTLAVPLGEIRAFSPGLDSHPEILARLEALIAKLSAASAVERDAAQADLVQMGLPIRAELQNRLREAADAELRTRLQAALDEIGQPDEDDAADPLRQEWQRQDLLQTPDFTIPGKVTPRQFDLTCTYGTLTINVADIRRMQRPGQEREEQRKSLEVDATCKAPDSLKSTELRVEKGDIITLTAEGELSMRAWGGWGRAVGGDTITPDGSLNYGWYTANEIAHGTLVMRIGKDGPVLKAGSKQTVKADRAGVLMLGIGIAPQYASRTMPGQYSVKVSIKAGE